MNYEQICESNRYLYATLEQLSYEISFCTIKGCEAEAQDLTRQKQGIQQLIDVNLEKLEKYWSSSGQMQRRIGNTRFVADRGTMQHIVDTFLHTKDNSIDAIAKKCGVTRDHVERTLTLFLVRKTEAA